MENYESLTTSPVVKLLQEHYEKLNGTHLRQLLSDTNRNNSLITTFENIVLDYTHEKINEETITLLQQLSDELKLMDRFEAMYRGDRINTTENRSVLHVALRKPSSEKIILDGNDIIPDVHSVLNRIRDFSENVRNGNFTGFSGRKIRNFISIGIGGSYLGVEFIYQSLKNHPELSQRAKGYNIHFLANVCPIDFQRAVDEFDPEETLIIIISKTFTTAETMLNARTCRHWIINTYKQRNPEMTEDDVKNMLSKHLCAVSTNLTETSKFGVDDNNVFGFWDWVGGRYSSWSAVGGVPLSLVFGYETFSEFLSGGNSIDNHLINTKSVKNNLPVLLGLLGFYNTFISNITTRAILPYSQALCKFANHIQQVDMESNGKSVSLNNKRLDYLCGPVVFGEPGTNGQHSFYQLIHQGRTIACEFIGYARSQCEIKHETVSNHDELMSNFFAQPDALALGKFPEELVNVSENLKPHKTFNGDRPSLSLLFNELNAYTCGQLLAIYEHRIATEGFIYNVNSFDQWGVELGKTLSTNVRNILGKVNQDGSNVEDLTKDLNTATSKFIQLYVQFKKN